MRWLKTWGTLIVAIVALALSGYAIYVDNVHYQEITKPHTEHEEIYDRLARLDNRIERVEQSIGDVRGSNVEELYDSLMEAKQLRDQAELAWDEGRYTDADEFIKDAYDNLPRISPMPLNWWLIIGIIAAVIAVATVVWLAVIRQRTWE
jgi:hypothetical protein